MGHEPGGTSTRTVWHYAQEINSGKFCKFDYDSMFENWLAYRSFSPPEYDLKKVDIPVALIWSDNDWLADPTVIKSLWNHYSKTLLYVWLEVKAILICFGFNILGCKIYHRQFTEIGDEHASTFSQVQPRGLFVGKRCVQVDISTNRKTFKYILDSDYGI